MKYSELLAEYSAQVDKGRIPPDAESISLAWEVATDNSMPNFLVVSELVSEFNSKQ